MSGVPGAGRGVGRAGAGEGERVDDPVVEFLADPVGERGLLEGLIVIDGVVGDGGGLVVAAQESGASGENLICSACRGEFAAAPIVWFSHCPHPPGVERPATSACHP
jgi:hypothetical protein